MLCSWPVSGQIRSGLRGWVAVLQRRCRVLGSGLSRMLAMALAPVPCSESGSALPLAGRPGRVSGGSPGRYGDPG